MKNTPMFKIYKTTDEDYGNQTVWEIRKWNGVRYSECVIALENEKEAQQRCGELNGTVIQKHTPTPWEVMDTGNSRNEVFIRTGATPIVKLLCGFSQNDKANAEFIVRAVNSHEELLQACKLALEFITDLPLNQTNDVAPFYELKTAIAKAEGK